MAILRLVDNVCRVIVGIAVLVMVVSIFGQVFYRTALDSYLGWAEEAARFSFVWLVFLGSVSAFRGRRHLSIDFLPELLGLRGKVAVDLVICLVILAFSLVLTQYGYRLTLRTMSQTAPATGIIMGYVYMALPLGAALIGLFSAVDLVRNIRGLAKGDLSLAAIQPQQDTEIASHREEGA